MTPAVDVWGSVKCLESIGPGLHRLVVEAPQIALRSKPGQFVHVKVCPGRDPLLRRPMSISGVSGRGIEMLFEVVGRGTQSLSERRVGEKLRILGPLGKGFTLPGGSLYPVLVGGGMGVPPLLFLAGQMRQNGTAFLGSRTKRMLVGVRQLRGMGWKVILSTDDGTQGTKGLVSDLFANGLKRLPRPTRVYACGPIPMLSAVARRCAEAGLACEVSLEAVMACGVGVCRGCVVPVVGKGRYMDLCREGPVVDSRKIAWGDLMRAP